MSGSPRAGGSRWVLLIALTVVALAAAGLLIFKVADDGDSDASAQSQRDAVMSVSRKFMLAINTYGPKLLDDQNQMPAYRKDVTALITPKFQASFDQSVTLAEQSVKAGLGRTSSVFGTGVSEMDDDSATVLVAGSFTNSYLTKKGKRADDEPVPFRVAVKVVRINGTWLVDDFAPVTGESTDSGTGSSQTPESTTSPSATTSGGAQ